MFSGDVEAAILVFPNKEMPACNRQMQREFDSLLEQTGRFERKVLTCSQGNYPSPQQLMFHSFSNTFELESFKWTTQLYVYLGAIVLLLLLLMLMIILIIVLLFDAKGSGGMDFIGRFPGNGISGSERGLTGPNSAFF